MSAADEVARGRWRFAAACGADAFLRGHPATVEITGARFASSRVAPDEICCTRRP